MPLSLSLKISIIVSAVMWPAQYKLVNALKIKKSSIFIAPKWTRKPEKLTTAPFQHLLALTVSAASFFDPACVHEGIDCGKVERGLPVPPAFALCIFPQVWVLFVYLGRYSVLIGDVSISLWNNDNMLLSDTLISSDPQYYPSFLPCTLSAAHIFPEVSSSHASFLSDMRKLLW